MVSDAAIRVAAHRLLEAAPNAWKIVLFGSYARGNAGANSDVDFLVVEPGPIDRRAEMVRLRRALRSLRLPVDLLVVTKEEVTEWGHLPGTALYPALREGKVLHDAT